MSQQVERLRAALAGRYEIERELGAGGMATVYLARDVRHDRQVAVKVLRAELAASLGAERFLREVRIAANLTHPHILPVHDSGEADGFLYYVMPFIDGESLRRRIDREGQLPVADTARILRDVLDALAHAHHRGIVHRDIKPDNVLLAGRHALVVDFGVAKAVSEATGRHDLTTVGVALGTPSYMAPEQASGAAVIDHRADLYAAGAMTYEMLTGRPPFAGQTAHQVLSAHLTASPTPVTDVRPNLPPALAGFVMRCLEKTPADRPQSAGEMVPVLEALSASTTSVTPAETTVVAPVAGRRSPRGLVPGLVAAAAVVAAIAAFVFRAPVEVPALGLGQRTQVARDAALEIDPALSPNGQFLAYASGTQGGDFRIFVRQIDGGSPIAVAPDLPGNQRFPSWSPDGGQLLFRSVRGIEIVPATGGVSRRLEAGLAQDRSTWSPDGSEIAWVGPEGLVVASRDAEGRVSRQLVDDALIHSPAWSPDGRWIAYVRGNSVGVNTVGNLGPCEIWVVPASGGERTQVTDSGTFNASPAWLGSTLLFVSDRDGGRDVYAVELASSGTAAGPPKAVTTGVNALSISVASEVDRLSYSVFLDRSNVWSMPIPEAPPASSLDATPVTSGNQVVEIFEVSRDGQWIAFDADRAGNQDIFKQPIGGGTVTPLTTDQGDDFGPTWSPDGSQIAFYSYRDDIPRQLLIMPADGGAETRVADGELSGPEFSPDGAALAARRRPDDALVVLRRTDDGWTDPEVVAPEVLGSYMAWSPDGRRLVYTSRPGLSVVDVVSRDQTVVLERPPAQFDGGQYYPQWSADGRWIYYLGLGLDAIFAVDPSGGDSREIVRFDPARPWHRYGFQATADRFYFTLGEVESDLWVAEIAR